MRVTRFGYLGPVCALACMNVDRDRDAPQPRQWPQVLLDPSLDSGRAAPVTRILLRFASERPKPTEPVLLGGAMTTKDLQELASGAGSPSLQARLIRTLAWTDGNSDLVIAATQALDLGAKYTVAIPAWNWKTQVQVADTDDAPMMQRVWPPPDQAASGGFAVWCVDGVTGGVAQPVAAQIVAMMPGMVQGRLEAGAVGSLGAECVRWTSLSGEPPAALVPPPTMLLADGRTARVQPAPLERVADEAAAASRCGAGTEPFGHGCLEMLDDRAVLTANGSNVWTGIIAGETSRVGVLDDAHPMVLRPLPIERELTVTGWELDTAGREAEMLIKARTGAMRAHLVLNEIMANPAGKEPDQEWVELYNDGQERVSLVGWVLEDSGQQTPLPDYEVAPGEYVLVVNASYREDSDADRKAAAGTMLLRVDRLGKSGLSNSGEDLRLRNDAGQLMSWVPAIASTKQSASIARSAPDSPDGLQESFWMCPDGGTPGGKNAR